MGSTVITVLVGLVLAVFLILWFGTFFMGWHTFDSDYKEVEVRSAMVDIPGLFWHAWLIGFRVRQGAHNFGGWISDRMPDEQAVADRRVNKRQKTMERILGKEL